MDMVVHEADPEIRVRDTTYADVLAMGNCLRESDVREIAALTDEAPVDALLTSYLSCPRRCYTAMVDGIPVLIAGCAVHPDDPDIGIPWMLATPAIYKRPFPRMILTHGRQILAELAAGLPYLINLTADPDHRDWLHGLGFGVALHELSGRNGEPLFVFAQGVTPCASPS